MLLIPGIRCCYLSATLTSSIPQHCVTLTIVQLLLCPISVVSVYISPKLLQLQRDGACMSTYRSSLRFRTCLTSATIAQDIQDCHHTSYSYARAILACLWTQVLLSWACSSHCLWPCCSCCCQPSRIPCSKPCAFCPCQKRPESTQQPLSVKPCEGFSRVLSSWRSSMLCLRGSPSGPSAFSWCTCRQWPLQCVPFCHWCRCGW